MRATSISDFQASRMAAAAASAEALYRELKVAIECLCTDGARGSRGRPAPRPRLATSVGCAAPAVGQERAAVLTRVALSDPSSPFPRASLLAVPHARPLARPTRCMDVQKSSFSSLGASACSARRMNASAALCGAGASPVAGRGSARGKRWPTEGFGFGLGVRSAEARPSECAAGDGRGSSRMSMRSSDAGAAGGASGASRWAAPGAGR